MEKSLESMGLVGLGSVVLDSARVESMDLAWWAVPVGGRLMADSARFTHSIMIGQKPQNPRIISPL